MADIYASPLGTCVLQVTRVPPRPPVIDRARARPPIAQDPLLVARMLVVGRECLDRTVRQFEEAQHRIQSKVENTRTR